MIFAVIPYATSYHSERKSGYLRVVSVKVGKLKYILSKLVASFISGALVVIIPLVLNVLIVTAEIPSYLDYFSQLLANFYEVFDTPVEISPLMLMRASHTGLPVKGFTVGLEIIVLLVCCVATILFRGTHDEIY